MEFVVLGWPPDGPTLRLDYRRFAYAGKFVMTNTGKAVVRDPASTPPPLDADDERPPPQSASEGLSDEVVAALAFNADRTDASVLWLRYVTVRADKRGEGLGPRLAAFVVGRAPTRGYDRARIAVNNPFAYHALYRAGFAYTGRETGVAELVLERPAGGVEAAHPETGEAATYQSGLDAFRVRELNDAEASFLAAKAGDAPPETISPRPDGAAADSGA